MLLYTSYEIQCSFAAGTRGFSAIKMNPADAGLKSHSPDQFNSVKKLKLEFAERIRNIRGAQYNGRAYKMLATRKIASPENAINCGVMPC